MRFSSRLRTTHLGVVLAVLALAVSACGGSDAEATDKPSESASTSATPTPSPTPTATPTAEPLSPFEDKAPVKALRAWSAAKNEAVNEGDRTLAAVQPIATARGMSVTKKLTAGDLDHNYYLPGPDPFTPVSVRTRGNHATLNVCMLNFGWSVDRDTQKPVNKRRVGAVVLELVRDGGRWKFDNGYLGTADCKGVEVKEVTW